LLETANLTLPLTGVWPILPTPFHDDEALDLDSLARVVRFMGVAGMDGVTVLGVLGEANRVTDAEREQVIRATVEAARAARAASGRRLGVVVGATHPGTRATIDHCRTAAALGADAVMVSPSHEPAPSDERVFEYFRRVAEGCPLPIVAQDHPASSGVFMGVPLLLRLVAELPRVACIKLEQPPTPPRIAALLAGMEASGGRTVTILQGLGALYGQFDLERGAHGFMTGFAFPEALRAMVDAVRAGAVERARAVFRRFLPLIVYEQQPGLAIRKEVYRLRGLVTSSRVRHPGGSIDPVTAAELRGLIAQVLPDADLSRPIAV
jgi:4-hydroxy-tetrahydrodipicolinate synthase